MIVFFSDENIVKKINDLCKISGETQSQIVEYAVLKYLSSEEAIKVIEAKSILSKVQLNAVTKLKSSTKIATLMSFLDGMNDPTLSSRYRKIISMRFGLGEYGPHTLEQIGVEIGVTRERVRQIIAKLLTDPDDINNKDIIDRAIDVETDDNYIYDEIIKKAEREVEDEIDNIISVVSNKFSLSKKDILSKRRTADVAFARQFAMYIVKTQHDISKSRIGRIFKRDHTTVMYALDQMDEKINKDLRLKKIYDNLISKLPTSRHD